MSKKKEEMGLGRIGTKGEYEVYTVMPSAILDTVQDPEISTHYKKNTNSLLSDSDDIVTGNVSVDGKSYEYVLFGEDNLAPYLNMQRIEQNMIMSQCQNFNILTCYSQAVRFLDRDTKKMTEDPDIRSFCLRNAIHNAWLRMAIDMKYNYFSVMVIHLSRDHKRI